jgi:hypothetical protein
MDTSRGARRIAGALIAEHRYKLDDHTHLVLRVVLDDTLEGGCGPKVIPN